MPSKLDSASAGDPPSLFSGKVRCRVCGLLLGSQGLLMIKHKGLGKLNYLWAPPGGGIDFGFTAEQALQTEFIEETGLDINVGDLLFVNEYRDSDFHAIELFFAVTCVGGELKLGHDPELSSEEQILEEIAFLSDEEILAIPMEGKHNVFRECSVPSDIMSLNGFFKFANN